MPPTPREDERPALRPLQVVGFRHRDPVLGTEYEGAGVVVSVSEDGGPVGIRPLQPHTVQVDPADVSVSSDEDEQG
jgi:hypothetical protein